MNKILFKNKGETDAVPINASNLNLLQDNVENEIKANKITVNITEKESSSEVYSCSYINSELNDFVKAAVWKHEYLEVGTSLNIPFNTMFPNLTLSKVICFITEIVNVDKTWDRTYANILGSNGTLQVRSYSQQQTLTVRVTALYK